MRSSYCQAEVKTRLSDLLRVVQAFILIMWDRGSEAQHSAVMAGNRFKLTLTVTNN